MYDNYSIYHAGILQSQSYRALSNFMSLQLAGFNLSLPEWKVLGHLSEVKFTTPSEISKLLGVKRPISSRLLNTLEAKKLIKRSTNPIDTRVVQVTITASGSKLFTRSELLIKKSIKDFF